MATAVVSALSKETVESDADSIVETKQKAVRQKRPRATDAKEAQPTKRATTAKGRAKKMVDSVDSTVAADSGVETVTKATDVKKPEELHAKHTALTDAIMEFGRTTFVTMLQTQEFQSKVEAVFFEVIQPVMNHTFTNIASKYVKEYLDNFQQDVTAKIQNTLTGMPIGNTAVIIPEEATKSTEKPKQQRRGKNSGKAVVTDETKAENEASPPAAAAPVKQPKKRATKASVKKQTAKQDQSEIAAKEEESFPKAEQARKQTKKAQVASSESEAESEQDHDHDAHETTGQEDDDVVVDQSSEEGAVVEEDEEAEVSNEDEDEDGASMGIVWKK